ncbi:hypothetical protein COM11_01115 [Bacillus pseudomycoides]|nr:hypothetical protein COM11_01115 [Bacillus pseudomycoides]
MKREGLALLFFFIVLDSFHSFECMFIPLFACSNTLTSKFDESKEARREIKKTSLIKALLYLQKNPVIFD